MTDTNHLALVRDIFLVTALNLLIRRLGEIGALDRGQFIEDLDDSLGRILEGQPPEIGQQIGELLDLLRAHERDAPQG